MRRGGRRAMATTTRRLGAVDPSPSRLRNRAAAERRSMAVHVAALIRDRVIASDTRPGPGEPTEDDLGPGDRVQVSDGLEGRRNDVALRACDWPRERAPRKVGLMGPDARIRSVHDTVEARGRAGLTGRAVAPAAGGHLHVDLAVDVGARGDVDAAIGANRPRVTQVAFG